MFAAFQPCGNLCLRSSVWAMAVAEFAMHNAMNLRKLAQGAHKPSTGDIQYTCMLPNTSTAFAS